MRFLRGNSGIIAGLLVGAVLGGVLLMVRFGGLSLGNWRFQPVNSVHKPADENGMTSGGGGLFVERRNAIVLATRKVAPAVVSIKVKQVQQITDPSNAMWERMGYIPQREHQQHKWNIGSGVIVSKDGLIVTNSHVLDNAVEIIVTLSDGSQYQARVVDIIDPFDLAVLQIHGNNFPVAHFAENDYLDIGEWAIAIGSPYGYLLADTQPTVTVGVISALNRDIKRKEDERNYLGMIQTDAAINPGNSGGPLVNTAGEVIGINTFIFSDTGGSVGIGFAVPAARVKQVLEEIREYGHYREGILGFELQKLSPGMMQYLGTNDPVGYLVLGVLPGSPAWKSGLRPRDIIREIGGNKLSSSDVWWRLVYEVQVGDGITFKAERKNVVFEGEIIIEESK